MYDPAKVAGFTRKATIEEEAAQHPWLAYQLGRKAFRAPSDEKQLRRMKAVYFGLMTRVDAALGELFQFLKRSGRWDSTLIIVTSDHGKQMGDHWMLGKGEYFDGSYRIPLIIRDPRASADPSRGARITAFTENIDIMPTLMELAPQQWKGEDSRGVSSVTARRPLKLPAFIGIGPPRTGTTWLHAALAEVVWLPYNIKETNFFSRRYDKGIEWYASHFRHADDSRPIGEICPYLGTTETIDHIAEHIPDCKIICTLRDPVERAFSHYRLKHRFDRTPPSFEEALASSTDQVIRENNRYAFYLRRWRQRFGADRVMVAFYDDLKTAPQQYLDRISDFIGARHVAIEGRNFDRFEHNAAPHRVRFPRAAVISNQMYLWLMTHDAYVVVKYLRRLRLSSIFHGGGKKYPPLTPEVDARVRAMFRPEIEDLEALIGRDLSAWKYRTDKPRSKTAATSVQIAAGEAVR